MKKKWLTILQLSFRDIIFLGFGAWIIWKQVYAATPNIYLCLLGVFFMVPSARAAIIAILSAPGPSSESHQPPAQQPSPSSSREVGKNGEGKQRENGVGGQGPNR